MELSFNVSEQDLKLLSECEQAISSKKVVVCNFYFDSSWTDFEKSALFESFDGIFAQAEIDESGRCIVPCEVIANNGHFHISVCGTTETIGITTQWIKVPVCKV